MSTNPLGEFIILRMKATNLIQAELSIFTGIAKSQLNEIIKGKRRISADNAIMLAILLEVKPEQLLDIQMKHQLKVLRNKTPSI